MLEQNKDECQFVNRPINPIFKSKANKAINLADLYDIRKDLAQAKANISFGQLIQLVPSLRKKMREEAIVRREHKIGQVNHLEDEKDKELHWNFHQTKENDYELVEIMVEVEDK